MSRKRGAPQRLRGPPPPTSTQGPLFPSLYSGAPPPVGAPATESAKAGAAAARGCTAAAAAAAIAATTAATEGMIAVLSTQLQQLLGPGLGGPPSAPRVT
ncbi:hypothetical protein Emag_004408 [Eimeria magna]